MTWRQRLLWSGIYALGAALLWMLGDHLMFTPEWRVGFPPSGGVHGGSFMATPDFAYLAAVICAVLSVLSLFGTLPRIPEDEPL